MLLYQLRCTAHNLGPLAQGEAHPSHLVVRGRGKRPALDINNCGAFQVVHGPDYMGLEPTMWVPMVLEHPYCYQMITNPSQGRQRVQEKPAFTEIFKGCLTT